MEDLDFTKGILKVSFIDFMLNLFDDQNDNTETSYLDNKGILWKSVNGDTIGKKAVKKSDYEYCWEEDL